MRFSELSREQDDGKERFMDMFSKFLPLAIKLLGLKKLPKMVLKRHLDIDSFGVYVNAEDTLYIALANRHPNDILRTVAHELEHFKQDTEGELDQSSGDTGSPEENKSNSIAGVIMRRFNELYPEYLNSEPVLSEDIGMESRLVIFDIDDTLVHTQTKVKIVKDGTVVGSLNSHDFTHYKLKPGESFDFGDFANAREFFNNAKPIIPMLNQLKRDIATGNKVVMVTARADFNDRELFLDTFRKYGVDMSKVHVYRAGNDKSATPIEHKKATIIRSLMDRGNYSKVIMYDDAKPNIESFINLKKEYPSAKFYAWHVSLDGDASEYKRNTEITKEPA